MSNQFDVNLTDDLLMEEVELLTVVIMAANTVEGRMSPGQVDAVLGLDADRSSTRSQDVTSS